MDATPASLHPASSFYAMTTFPIIVVALTSVIAFTSLGLFDPLVLPHLQRALGASYVYPEIDHERVGSTINPHG